MQDRGGVWEHRAAARARPRILDRLLSRRPRLRPVLSVPAALLVFVVWAMSASHLGVPLGARAAVVGAVVYPDASGGRILATIDEAGRARVCIRGSAQLELGDVSAAGIVYHDGTVATVPLGCGGSPRTVHQAEPSVQRLSCPTFSPDGTRVAVTAIGRIPPATSRIIDIATGAWRQVDGASCGWVDEDHLLASPSGSIDPYAIHAETGDLSLLQIPPLWRGYRARAGTPAVYDVIRPRAPVTTLDGQVLGPVFLLVAQEDEEHPILLTTGTQIPSARGLAGLVLPPSIWDPSGERFLAVRAASLPASLIVYGRGATIEREIGLPDPVVGPSEMRMGWLDADRIWWGTYRGIQILDLRTGSWGPIALPGHAAERPRLVLGSEMIVMTDAGRQGTAAVERSLLPLDEAPQALVGDPAATIRRPPSWTIRPCGCDVTGYPAVGLTRSAALGGGSADEPDVAIATIDADPVSVIRRIVERGHGIVWAVDPFGLFVVDDRAGTRTHVFPAPPGVILVRTPSLDEPDPSVEVILRSLREQVDEGILGRVMASL